MPCKTHSILQNFNIKTMIYYEIRSSLVLISLFQEKGAHFKEIKELNKKKCFEYLHIQCSMIIEQK